MPSHRYNAAVEVRSKSDRQLERETAWKWAARALACREEYKKTGKVEWLLRWRSYEDEALEHAAMVRDKGKTLVSIENRLEKR